MADSLIPRLIRRANVILHEDGLLAPGFRVLGETVHRRVLLARCDLSLASAPPDGRYRWLDPADAAAYAQYHPDLSEAEIRRRLAGGHRCWVLSSDGQFAHGLWVAPRAWIDYLGVELPLAPNEICLYRTFTPPALRGRGFASAALRAVSHELRHEGWQRIVLCIQPDRSIAYPRAPRRPSRPNPALPVRSSRTPSHPRLHGLLPRRLRQKPPLKPFILLNLISSKFQPRPTRSTS